MITIQTYDCETTGSHGVILKPHVDKEAFLSRHNITPSSNFNVINAFFGRFDQATIELLRASPDVKSISEDPIVSLDTIRHTTKP
ncbi:hypothetical protein BD779DRAFT_1579481 [Infundibulicybe gibba]|nr:hypothetical protein BD779DRAFT_1579481 [Infundibulicybe gibba]